MGVAGGPAEPEEADGDGEAADKGGGEALFGAEVAIGVEPGLEIVVHPGVEGGDGEEGADEDADEREALLAEGEAVDVDEDDGKGLEPDVEQAVDEGDVEVEEEDHGLEEVERDGPHHHHHEDVFAGHILAREFGLALELVVAGGFAEALGAPVEDVGRAGLG